MAYRQLPPAPLPCHAESERQLCFRSSLRAGGYEREYEQRSGSNHFDLLRGEYPACAFDAVVAVSIKLARDFYGITA